MTLKARILDALPSLILLVLAIGYLIVSLDYRYSDRAMPFGIASVAILLLLLDLLSKGEGRVAITLRRVLQGRAQAKVVPGLDGQAGMRVELRRELAAFGWIFGFLLIVVFVGFYTAIPIYVFAFLWLHGRKSVLRAGLTALGLTTALYVMFELLLGYNVFGGLIAGGYL